MKKLIPIVLLILFNIALFSCKSVKSQGINYFIGRTEADIIKHFGYNGIEIESSDNNYDRVMYFTNKVTKYQMNKVKIVNYKVARQTEIMTLDFYQYPDGCLFELDSQYYGSHYSTQMAFDVQISRLVATHRNNNNARIVPKINDFNSIVNKYTSFPNSQRASAFERSNIGDTYFLYETKKEQQFSSGVQGVTPSEIYTYYLYMLWRVNIVSEDRPETESWIVAIYNERSDLWYTGNGNNIISLERANDIRNEYIYNGYTQSILTEGNSLFVYFLNGKIINVEERK
jgi:hypothetical protein